MAGTPAKATAPKAGAGSAELTEAEQAEIRAADERDQAVTEKADTSGKRVRAIPAIVTKSNQRSTTVEVRRSDFKTIGIDHPTVVWDFRKDNFTVKVGEGANQISAEAAKALTEQFPTSFEYIAE